jgi:hypothetical protein
MPLGLALSDPSDPMKLESLLRILSFFSVGGAAVVMTTGVVIVKS